LQLGGHGNQRTTAVVDVLNPVRASTSLHPLLGLHAIPEAPFPYVLFRWGTKTVHELGQIGTQHCDIALEGVELWRLFDQDRSSATYFVAKSGEKRVGLNKFGRNLIFFKRAKQIWGNLIFFKTCVVHILFECIWRHRKKYFLHSGGDHVVQAAFDGTFRQKMGLFGPKKHILAQFWLFWGRMKVNLRDTEIGGLDAL
jgi:hypothetical protein